MTLVSLQENFSHETKEKIQAGVIRLNEILPLKARLAQILGHDQSGLQCKLSDQPWG